ncbi:MAG: hypothetical protein U0350_32315 [Caldilineaceae bacterium]
MTSLNGRFDQHPDETEQTMGQIFGAKFDAKWVGDVSAEAALTYLQAVRMMLKQDRRRGLAALHELFRSGDAPTQPLHGRYVGELLVLEIAPILTQVMQHITQWWMPWLGKQFDAAHACGDTILHRSSLPWVRLLYPFYRHIVPDSTETYRAFSFRTWLGPGQVDPDVRVLKIDYNLPENPRPTIRRVLDEVVELAESFYLGKAHLCWWWGRWQMVGYFMLRAV